MKKRVLNLFVALTFVTASVFGSNVTSIITLDAQSIIVDTKNWKSDYVSVEIRDNEDVLVYDDTFSSQERKKLNLKNLPEGTYSIALSNDIKTTTQLFTLRRNEVVELSETHTTYKPMIKINNQYVDLNFMAENEPVSVTIYGYNDEVFTTTYDNGKSINKRYDIQRLPAGTYTFNVSSNNTSYSKIFRK